MLHRYRRYWVLLTFALLIVPFAAGVLAPAGDSVLTAERRVAAPFPVPVSAADWLALPRKLDSFLADHFGLRHHMIRGQAVIANRWLAGSNARVLKGRDGWLFYKGDYMIEQSAGLLVREARVNETADFIASMQSVLSAQGIKFIFAAPPNAATVHPEKLPDWARNRGWRTEYDLMLAALAVRRVPAIDLRPLLIAARSRGAVYRQHDTHWSDRGALAGFNAIAEAIGHTDWGISEQEALKAPAETPGGDLADMLGLGSSVKESVEEFALPRRPEEPFTQELFPTFQATGDSGTGGPIMVIGDSFTMHFFPPMVLRHVGRIFWTHHKQCGFDWKWIEKFQPREIWWVPTERYILCVQRPINFPPDAKTAALSASAPHSP